MGLGNSTPGTQRIDTTSPSAYAAVAMPLQARLAPWSLALLTLSSLGCSGSPAAAGASLPQVDRPGESRCGVMKSQAQPLIVEWPSAERGKLEVAIRRGPVAVRYVGCEMEVLGQCSAPGKYIYASLTRKHDRVAMKDADDLYANLPVGAAKLEAELARSGELDVEMTIVGRMEAERTVFRRDELPAGCQDATHVITAVTLGAFKFFAGAEASVGGEGSVLGAGAGAKSSATRSLLNNDGDPALCEKASLQDVSPPEGCGALLRLEVVALGEPKAVECPAGTSLQNGGCVANVNTACPGGMRFETGKGCVPLVAATPVPTPAAATVPAAAVLPSPRGAGMVSFTGGTFAMGSNSGADDEKPVHSVRVGAFSMDITEVTVEAYAACVKDGKCTEPDSGTYCNWKKPARDRHPINCVDWEQATAYCGSVGKRLPTEEEWEYAARGTAGREYPWGSAAPSNQLCWDRLGDGKPNSTCTVGSYSAGSTPEGLMDMAGNVWEWTSSPYCPYGSNGCAETARVLRGGCWYYSSPSYVRGANRYFYAPSFRFYLVGFRCARAN